MNSRMTLKRTLVLTVLSLLVIAAAVTAAISLPGPGNAQQKTDGILDIVTVTGESGVTAWLVEDHSLPVIALSFSFQGAGAALDGVEKQGLSTLASNTMDEGAGEYDSQTFQALLADHAISLSFSASRDDFGGSLKTLTRHKDLAFKLLGLALTQPRFDDEAIERMRAANIARLRNSLANPDWIAARLMNDTAFAGHPYALNSGGTLTTLASLSKADLENFAKTRLARGHLHIAVAGAITPAELRAVMDAVFGPLPAQADLPAVADLTVQNGGRHVHYVMDIPQTIIQMMQPGIGRDDPDYYAAAVMDFILGSSGFGSRLTEEVREKRGLTYGIHTGFYLLDHLKGYSVSTSTKNETTATVIALIGQEWRRMRDTPVTAKELADAQSYLIGSLPLALSSTDNIAGLLLGLQLDGLPIGYLDQRAARIRAVTVADVQRVAQRMLTPDSLTLVTVGGKPETLAPQIVESLPHVD